MKVLSDIDVSGKRVFVRADLDVPSEQLTLRCTQGHLFEPEPQSRRPELAERVTIDPSTSLRAGSSKLAESIRLKSLKPTVDYLLQHEASRIIIAGHIGRPSFTKVTEGKPPLYSEELSTKQLLEPLEKILERRIDFLSNFVILNDSEGSKKRDSSSSTQNDNQLVLLENLRFWPGEVENDQEFAKKLASMADIYINEAFGNCHRNHASMAALPQLFTDVEDLLESERPRSRRPEGFHPRRAVGLHLEKEVEVLGLLLDSPQRPFIAIVGGAKIETKVPAIENLARIADWVLVGGAIAREFQISNFKFQISNVVVATSEVNDKDIDQESIGKFKQIISTAKSVVWNGPMGIFEEGFEKGTMAIAKAIVDSGAYSIVGGGETTEFLSSKELISPPAGGFSFVSVGGGAMLEFLAGKKLPGLKALQ